MPELNFSVYCGICGKGVCADTVVDGKNNVTVTCSFCVDHFAELEKALESAVEESENRIAELKDLIADLEARSNES